MRWEQLFDDLEAQLEAEQRRELDLEVADRTRRERAALGLHERLGAHRGRTVELRLAGGQTVAGAVSDVGADWLLVGEREEWPSLVPFTAIVTVGGIPGLHGEQPAPAGGAMAKRFGFGYALRGLSRDRAVVRLSDVAGGATTRTIDAVGADVLDLSEHPADLPRRAENVIARRVVPFSAVAVVRPA